MTVDISNKADRKNQSEQSDLPDDNSTVLTLNYENSRKNSKKETGSRDDQSGGFESCDFEAAIHETGYGKYNILLLLTSIPAIMTTVNATTSLSMILPSAGCDLDLSNFEKGLLNAIPYIGMVCSAFFWGFISDTLGRKNPLIIAFFLEGILSAAVALIQNLTSLLVVKFFSGFICGGPYSILMAYLAECHSSKYRASVIVWTGTFFAAGTIVLAVAAWVIVPLAININLWDGRMVIQSWRVFLLVGSTPSLLTAVLLSFFLESPKFLMTRGRRDEALDIFRTIYKVNTGKPKESFPVKSLMKEVDEPAEVTDKRFRCIRQGLNQMIPLFRKPHISNALLIFIIQIFTVAGLNTIRLWSPQLFSTMIDWEQNSNRDFVPTTACHLLTPNVTAVNVTPIDDHCMEQSVESRTYLDTIIMGGVLCLGYLVSGYLVAIFGKKLLLILMNLLGSLCCLGMYWSTSSNAMLALTSAYVTLISSSSTIIISIVVDLFPTSLRSMSVSLAMMFARSGGLIGNLVFPLLLDWNCDVIFFLTAASVIGSAILGLLLPKTKGAALK